MSSSQQDVMDHIAKELAYYYSVWSRTYQVEKIHVLEELRKAKTPEKVQQCLKKGCDLK